jgi:hypothetical protein
MAISVENDQICPMDEFLNRDKLKCYLDFISNINFSKDEEAEKITSNLKESLWELSEVGFFSKQIFIDIEKYFLISFSPNLIKKISKESISAKTVKDNLWKVVGIYMHQMIKNFESHYLFDIWDALVNFFYEDTLFIRSINHDASDKFLVTFFLFRNTNTTFSILKPMNGNQI